MGGKLPLAPSQTGEQVVGQVATAVSAPAIALASVTGRASLPSAALAPAVGNERPKPMPGSFRIFVVAP